MVEEVLVIVGRLHRAGYVSLFINMPKIQSNMVLVVLKLRNDGCLQEGSDQKGQCFVLDIDQFKTSKLPWGWRPTSLDFSGCSANNQDLMLEVILETSQTLKLTEAHLNQTLDRQNVFKE